MGLTMDRETKLNTILILILILVIIIGVLEIKINWEYVGMRLAPVLLLWFGFRLGYKKFNKHKKKQLKPLLKKQGKMDLKEELMLEKRKR